MEQCRKAGKSHWYHETQSTMSSQPPLSLMPEAAYVNDRFFTGFNGIRNRVDAF
ncbi:putative cytoplasmic protein [Salmonella enterica subsp. enterica serovar Daytona]|uniref:Putative cytoplasmic protein n=1 Tax=Salmonella enterica subsp. enterica serovar Daytona TaxID=1962639 RepID=A0A447JIR2_SALET|nr:putative cytoplasmic protein [Salmonella enterica subsp. enterica serovar Daytona]